ncbi:MAG: VanW family protein [Gaiellaceae bacterium]
MKRGVVFLVVVLVAACAVAVARGLQFRGVAKPGVHVLGIDVEGDGRPQIEREVRRWGSRVVTIRTGDRSYHVPRGWLVSVDAKETATRALAAGSELAVLVPARVEVRPVVRPARSSANVLRALAELGRAPASADVELRGTSVVVTRARMGRRLDNAELLRRLAGPAAVIHAPFRILRPAVTDAAARRAAVRARGLVARPVAIEFHGAQRGALTPRQLASAVHVVRRGHGFDVSLDGGALARLVRPRLGMWIRRAHNAQFVVEGDRVRATASQPGHDVDPSQLVGAIEAATTGNHAARVELGERQPDLTTADANALGIREKLVSFTTDMGVSSSNRVHNVHLMADFIDGTLIKPGEVFSFNRVVGPRTSERGFLEGQMIVGSLVLPSIGGGVCQTATTLFNNAFELGLPILARTNHNLYLSHYPLGRDATVSWGGPDFEFKNDLKHGLLIKTSYTDATLTFTFYGTDEKRRVVAKTGPRTNWTSPSMNYAIDPNAPRRSVKVVDGTGEKGFDVTVERTVYDTEGKELRHDVFKSHYIPDSPTKVYGPGRTPPTPYIVLPSGI